MYFFAYIYTWFINTFLCLEIHQIKSFNSIELYCPNSSKTVLTFIDRHCHGINLHFLTYKLVFSNMQISSSFVPSLMTSLRKESHKQLENAQYTLELPLDLLGKKSVRKQFLELNENNTFSQHLQDTAIR